MRAKGTAKDEGDRNMASGRVCLQGKGYGFGLGVSPGHRARAHGIAAAVVSNSSERGVGEQSTSIATCSASYHSYGSHITRMAANGTSLSLFGEAAPIFCTVAFATAA